MESYKPNSSSLLISPDTINNKVNSKYNPNNHYRGLTVPQQHQSNYIQRDDIGLGALIALIIAIGALGVAVGSWNNYHSSSKVEAHFRQKYDKSNLEQEVLRSDANSDKTPNNLNEKITLNQQIQELYSRAIEKGENPYEVIDAYLDSIQDDEGKTVDYLSINDDPTDSMETEVEGDLEESADSSKVEGDETTTTSEGEAAESD